MMVAVRRTSQFKEDVKRMQQQGRHVERLRVVLETLVNGEQLAPSYGDHVLVRQYRGTRECRIEPDWVLIYERTETEIVLIRTGSSCDLFE
jgi:mRNA interferase YafQ